jgi:hypothetical protein
MELIRAAAIRLTVLAIRPANEIDVVSSILPWLANVRSGVKSRPHRHLAKRFAPQTEQSADVDDERQGDWHYGPRGVLKIRFGISLLRCRIQIDFGGNNGKLD